MSFLGFLGQVVPWALKKAIGEGGFGVMLERLKPWGKAATGAEAAGIGGGAKGGKPPSGVSPGTPNDDWLLSGTWLHVASSNVEAIRYLYDEQILEIEFKSGRHRFGQYFNVDPKTASDFHDTTSPGRFVWNRLRDRPEFPYVRVTALSTKDPLKRKPSVVRSMTPKEIREKGFPKTLALKPPWQK